MNRRRVVIFGAWVAGVLGGTQAAEPRTEARGRELFAACVTCHTSAPVVVTGPELKDVIGRKAGTVPGFRYSRALRNAKVVWSVETMDSFLENPQRLIPGNAMPYPGLPDAKDRQALIAYLRNLP